ncbi:MAG: hypothetical protein V1875_09060 [Candidatus Altiarchaeota archaeon]
MALEFLGLMIILLLMVGILLTLFAVNMAIEVAVAFVLGLRTRYGIAAVALVNLLTYPILMLLLVIGPAFDIQFGKSPLIFLLEGLIVVVEWRLLAYALGKSGKRILAITFAMNLISFLPGCILSLLL